jgi:hypothetical protein
MDESPVEQARKYVESRKGWRPQRRTVEYLVGMLVILVAGAIIIPRVLPGTIIQQGALIGRNGGISVLDLENGTAKKLIPPPGKNEGYSAWGMSESREEVVAAWYHQKGSSVDRVSVRSMSGFSGRTHAQWALEGENTKPSQVGYLPTHNVIWVLVSGRIKLVDIKSARIFELPLEAMEKSGKKKKTTGMSYVSFSPESEKLAYAQGNTLAVLTGFTKELGRSVLRKQVVLEPGITRDTGGNIINGVVGSFTWVDERTLIVVMANSAEPNVSQVSSITALSSPVYMLQFTSNTAPRIALRVPAPQTGRFMSVSASPRGTDFALFKSDAQQHATFWYSASGKLVKSVKLGPGDWQLPLRWAAY